MRKIIALVAAIVAVALIGLSIVHISGTTGRGTYEISDAVLGGVNIAGVAQWEDYPGHTERHEPAKLYDELTNYWWCSSDSNCSVTATFNEPKTINEIHIHACNIGKDKYIPKTFTIELNEGEGFEAYKLETNNTYLTDYKYQFPEPKTVSGVKIDKLLGNSFYGIGEYVLPCIEEVEIYKVAPVQNDTVTEPVQEKMGFWARLKWLIFGD